LHDNIMYYLVAILFAVGWIQGAIIRNFDSSRSPISNKYLNHGIIVCLFTSFLRFIVFFHISYLLLLSLIPHLYKVNRMSGKILSIQYLNKDVISCFYSFVTPLTSPSYSVSSGGKLTILARHSAVTQLKGVRKYSSSEPLSNTLPIQEVEVDKDISLKNFYEWLSGITDGEGSFYILRRNDRGLFEFRFLICLHIDDIHMLHVIHRILGIGKVHTSGKTARFSVTTLKDIEKILNIFTKYPLNSSKILNFLDFKKAYELYTSSSSKEDVAQYINDLKNGMNTKRIHFEMPIDFKPRITSYWLLGFVEGEGSFFVKKDQYKLTFTLTQSIRDYALMESIRDFMYNLPGVYKQKIDKTSIRINITKDSMNKNPITRLTITKIDLIKDVIIPFFSSMTWRSKKELDYQDWVSIFKLKERGHHYQEEGIKILNLIISQMNNSRLSTHCDASLPKVGREQLYFEISKLLNGPSNIEVKEEGRLFIKSLNRFSASGNTKVQIIEYSGLILNTFTSLTECAKFLGVSQTTVKNRLIENQLFLFENKPCCIKIMNKENELIVSSRPEKEILINEIKLKISTRPSGVGKPVNIYEKFDSSDFKLIGSFVSVRRAGKFLGISGSTIIRYIQSGQIYKERYKISVK